MAAQRSLSCKAILFDLDGVLVDSAECVERTWREWATRHRLDPESVIAVAHGRRSIETVQLVAPQLSAEAELALLAASESTTSEGVYEIMGARELLELLPADKWAVVTSGIRAVAEFRLRHARLPVPPVMICADCLVIEDAPVGIEAARVAGMRVIAITTTYSRRSLTGADAVVERLTDLSVVLDRDQIRIDIPAPSV